MSRRQPIDARLALPAAAAWAAAALVQTWSPRRVVGLVIVAVALTAMVALARRCGGRVGAAVVAGALGVGVGASAMAVHVAALRRGAVAALAADQRTVELGLRLVRDPVEVRSHTGRPLTVVDATAYAVRPVDGEWRHDHAPVTVFALHGSWLGLLPGQRVLVAARLRRPRPGDLVAAVAFATDDPRLVGVPPFWQRWAGRVRAGLRDACAGLGADERGLVPGLVLGDVAAMPADLVQAFRMTGLTHLCAVSGANVAIVVGAVLGAARRVGLGRRGRTTVALALLPAFVVLVRPSPSVLRAAVMGAVVLVAGLVGRRAAALPVLSAAVLTLVLIDPFLARTAGFAMSVLATAAIVLVAPAWTDRLSRQLPRPLAAAVVVPTAAQLACTPVLVAAFGQLTPWAIPANLLAAPAVAPATLTGIACAVTAVVAPGPARLLARIAGVPAGWLAVVARTLSALPGAGMTGPSGVAGLAVAAAVVGVVVVVAGAVRRRRREMLHGCRP